MTLPSGPLHDLAAVIPAGVVPVAGVIGWPVDHSLSPRLHGYWLEKYGIDGAYLAFAVRPEDFETTLDSLAPLGLKGVNVTLPHKERAFARMDRLSAAARRVGAVNTVTVGADGGLSGDNTDGFGFLENLKAQAPRWQAMEGPAVVLGAGGAARAVVAALLDAGVPEVRLTNRTEARAGALADDLGGEIRVVPWPARAEALAGAALLVNTTTQGMVGQPPLDLVLDELPFSAAVADIVYTPLETPLLRHAMARGHATVDGLGMLLHQGRPGFARWFGRDPEVSDDLRRHVLSGMD